MDGGDEWKSGSNDWMDGWRDGGINEWRVLCFDGWIDGWRDRIKEGQTD